MVTQTAEVNTDSNNSCVSIGKYFYHGCASSPATAFRKQSGMCNHRVPVPEKEMIDCLIPGNTDAT